VAIARRDFKGALSIKEKVHFKEEIKIGNSGKCFMTVINIGNRKKSARFVMKNSR